MARAGTRSMRRSSDASVKRVAVCSATSTALMQVRSHRLCSAFCATAPAPTKRNPRFGLFAWLVVGDGPWSHAKGIPRNASNRERCPKGLASLPARAGLLDRVEVPGYMFVCPYVVLLFGNDARDNRRWFRGHLRPSFRWAATKCELKKKPVRRPEEKVGFCIGGSVEPSV